MGLAAVLHDREAGRLAKDARVGTVLCGANVDSDMFAAVLAHRPADSLSKDCAVGVFHEDSLNRTHDELERCESE